MSGLNKITGTGRQTIEELKRSIVGVDDIVNDVEVLQTEMATAQGDIEQLDTDFQALDARVEVLETSGTTEDTCGEVTVVESTRTRLLFKPSVNDELFKEIMSPVFSLSAPTTADLVVGSGTATTYWTKEGDGSGSYFPLYLKIPAGTQKFRVYFNGNKRETIVYVLDTSNNNIVSSESKCICSFRAGNWQPTAENQYEHKYMKGEFLTINLSPVLPEGSTITVDDNIKGYYIK